MAARWRYLPRDSHDLRAAAEAVCMLPGVRVLRGAIVSPCNAAPIVERLLRAARIAVSTHAPKRTGPTDARLALPYLRPWVPAFLVAYQRAAVSFLLARPDQSGLVIHPPGAGKTLTAIVWALALPGLIVVVTKAAVRHQWLREIARYTVLTGELLEGQTARDLGSKGAGLPRFLVVGHETLPHWIDELERVGPCSVVFDESHRIRSWRRWTAIEDGEHADGSARLRFAVRENIAAAAMRLSRGAERRICTTATPIVNLLRDLWSQTDLGDPGGFGGFYCWAKRYCAATQDSWGGIDTRGMSNLAELRERLEVITHRVSHATTHRELPPKRRQVVYLAPSEQKRAAGAIAKEARAAMRRGGTARIEWELMESAGRKRASVLGYIDDALRAKQKAVVFTGRRADCEALAHEARKRWEAGTGAIPGLTVWSGHGGDSSAAREAMRAAYMTSEGPALLVGTVDAWGEGLDLQDTDLLVMAMLPYTPGQIIQAEGRVARLGQRRPVLILYVICEGTVDEHVASILLAKLPAVEEIGRSDEVSGFARELIGASDDELISRIAAKAAKEATA